MERKEIYKCIDEERDYQDSKWGGHNHDMFHKPEAWIMYIEHYLKLAKNALSTENIKNAYPIAMDNMRKVVALGVACLENYNCPSRNEKTCTCGEGDACNNCHPLKENL